MKNSLIGLLFLILGSPFTSLSQAPQVQWQKVLGNGNGDYASTIRQTPDGGYIICGFREGRITNVSGNTFHQDAYLWVIKLDGSGNIQWENHVLDGTVAMSDIVLTPDGGYLVVTAAWIRGCNVANTNVDTYAIKLDAGGEEQWRKNYGGSANEEAKNVGITADNGFIISGNTESNNGDVSGNHGQRDFWIIKISSTGQLIWQQTLGGSLDDEAYSLVITADGGCVVGGRTWSTNGNVTGNHGKSDAWIVRLSASGNLMWQKCLGGSMMEVANSMIISGNGGFMVALTSNSNDGDVSGLHNSMGPFSDFWVVELAADGAINWSKCYGGRYNEEAFDIVSTPDGGYALTGSAQSSDGDVSCNKGNEDLWLIKINGVGALQWQKSFGGSMYEFGFSMQSLSDGSYIIIGETCSKEIAGYHPNTSGGMGSCGDYYLLKLTAGGAPPATPTLTIDPASATICAGLPATLYAAALNAAANTTYTWEKNGATVGENNPYYTSPDLKANDVIKCTIFSQGSCEANSATASAVVAISNKASAPLPEINIVSSADVLCFCQDIRFQAAVINSSSSGVYTWKVNSKIFWNNRAVFVTNELRDGDVVTCEYADASRCLPNGKVISNAIHITSGNVASPSINLSTLSPVVCAGMSVTVKARAINGGSKPTYRWTVNGQPAGSNADTLVLSTPANGDKIKCALTVDPQFTCSVVASVYSTDLILQVKSKVQPSITIKPSSTTLCKGASTTVTLKATNAGTNPSLQWWINDQLTPGTSTTFTTSSLVNGDKLWAVLIPGSDLCDATPVRSDTVSFRVYNSPEVRLSPVDTVVKRGSTVRIVANVSGDYVSYSWKPENLLSGGTGLETSTIPLRESAELNFTVVNEQGCRAEISSKIRVRSALFMANAFTPDGDGHNDVFRIPEGTTLTLGEFSIFDRWGNRVFSTRNIEQVWNGTFNGRPASAAVYVYLITGSDDKGPVLKKGTVTLIR